MANITVEPFWDTALDAGTKQAAREALDIYLTTSSSVNLAMSGTGTLTFALSSTRSVTVPTSGSGHMLLADSTAILTNKTFDTAGSGNSFSINGVAATANTGTGAVVRATAPTISDLTVTGDLNVSEINDLFIGTSVPGTQMVVDINCNFTGSGVLNMATTGATTVTLPTLGTLATLAGTETFSNKTLASAVCTTSIRPSGTASLGTSTDRWSNLYLNTSGTIDFNNGNWVATHSSGILTVGTGDLRVTTAGTNSASVVTTAGTQSLTNKSYNGLSIVCGSPITLTMGADDVELNTGGSTNITLPTTGTLATLAGTEALTNKTVRPTVTDYTSDGAITHVSAIVTISKTSAAAMTVAAPSSIDGTRMTIISKTAFAHVVTFSGGTLWDGTAGVNTTATFANVAGASLTVVALGSNWYLESANAVTIAP